MTSDRKKGEVGHPVEHYFAPRQDLPHQRRYFAVRLRGQDLTFVTDAGVFSKEKVDAGTRLLAEAMEIEPADIVLDLGCGYGPLGVVAGKLAPQGRVYCVDVNPRAVELARENLARNGVTNAEAREGDGLGPVEGMKFDKILLNPPIRAGKEVVYGLIAGAGEHLNPGGTLWVVIRTKQGAPSLRRFMEGIFTQVEEREKGGGYRVFRCGNN